MLVGKEILGLFLEHLRTDPKFYYETGEELLQAYRAMSKEIDAYMPTLFNKMPRAPYGVIPIPMESAPYTTTAYYNLQVKADQVITTLTSTNLKPDQNTRYLYYLCMKQCLDTTIRSL